MLRNERGVLLCHSRRAFSNVGSLDDAKLVGVLWSLESMGSQRISNVVVAGEFAELFGAVERSQAWPSFLHQIEEIKRGKDSIDGCQLLRVEREVNKGATFIAQSVTKLGLMRSYVQNGHPPWFFQFFVNEKKTLLRQ